MTDQDKDTQALYNQMIRDLCQAMRERMTPEQNAIIDILVLVELGRREQREDFHLELRLVADKHVKAAPYLAALLKTLSDVIRPRNPKVVPIFRTTPPGGKPCP